MRTSPPQRPTRASGAEIGGEGRLTRSDIDPLSAASAAFLLSLAAAALLAPALFPGDPSRIDLANMALPPSQQHILGTDLMGRDLLKMAAYGARVSLSVGVTAAATAAVMGLILGLVAAYSGGWIDAAICRLVDASIAMPAFFLLIAIQSLLGPGLPNVILMVSLVGWMLVARVVRATTLSLKEREFVLAARSLGCSGVRIVFRHILPNLLDQVTVLYALGVADALLMESALSFLGLGLPITQPSWGNMLSDAQAAILSGAWWVALFPGGLILLTALAINLVGDGLQALFRVEA